MASPPGGPTTMLRGAAVRVVIAEDSVLLREGLGRILAEYGDEVVAALGDGGRLVRDRRGAPRPTS